MAESSREAAPFAAHVPQRRTLRRRLGLHAGGAKRVALLGGQTLVTRAPESVVGLVPPLAAGMVRAVARLPASPLLRTCEDVAVLAAARGHLHEPRNIAARLAGQIRGALALAAQLYREGPSQVLPHLVLAPDQERTLADLRERYGSVVIAVPHNVGTVLYAMRVADRIPSLVVAKRSRSVEVCQLYLETFRRMGVEAVLADRRRRMAVMRQMLGAVRAGQVLVATVDRISRKPEAIRVPVFGREAGFDPWAVRIAAQRRIPVLPVYVSIDEGRVRSRVRSRLGEPILDSEPEAAMAGAMRFFESEILRDPGSWAFMLDKRWRRVLRDARTAVTSSASPR